jgi:hypothetical protein
MGFGWGTEFGRKRPSSPCATDEERAIFLQNERNLRKAVEEFMVQTGLPNKHLFIFSKGSSYVLQEHCIAKTLIEIENLCKLTLVNRGDVNIGVPKWRRDVYPDVWKDFHF